MADGYGAQIAKQPKQADAIEYEKRQTAEWRIPTGEDRGNKHSDVEREVRPPLHTLASSFAIRLMHNAGVKRRAAFRTSAWTSG